jgi:uncharacterized integral membrane protein (TIGR00698 family)
LAAVAVIALAARWANGMYEPLSAVAVAMVLGLLWRNTLGVPEVLRPGSTFAVKRVLRLAIILLGIRLSFVEVLRIGGSSLAIIVTCIVLSLLVVYGLTRLLRVPSRMGALIGVGSCICGNSAIMATAPAIDAEEDEVSFAVATITLFGLLAVLVYPLIGHVLAMSQTGFGIWAGTAINDTSQVVTAGFIFGEEAGNTATVVKLTRNLFMAPVIVLMGFLYHRKADSDGKGIDWKKCFPLFVLGFLGMAVLRTTGVLPPQVIRMVKTAASFLIVCAIAGVGMGTSFKSMRKQGLKPFYVGLAGSLIMGGVSYLLIGCLG